MNPPNCRNNLPQAAHANQRIQWSTDEYKEVIWCHWYIKESTGIHNIKATYDLWRERNPKARPHLNANKLATQRRYIQNKKKLTEEQLEEIKADVNATLEALDAQHTIESTLGDTGDAEHYSVSQNALSNPNNTETESDTSQTNEALSGSVRPVTQTPELEPEIPSQEMNTPEKTIPESILRSLYQEILKMSLEEREPITKLNGAKKEREIITRINNEVQDILENEENLDLWKINCLLYAAALTISNETNGTKANKRNKNKASKPLWQKRIEIRIQDL